MKGTTIYRSMSTFVDSISLTTDLNEIQGINYCMHIKQKQNWIPRESGQIHLNLLLCAISNLSHVKILDFLLPTEVQ